MMDNTIERRTNNLTHVETMFDARRTPWDGLGKRIAGAVTSRDAIRLAGLDWNVVPTDIISEATGLKIPGYKANVRDIDNKTLGIVTERYKIVQNEEAFSFTDALLGEGVRYETAGALQSGKKVWMLARLEAEDIADFATTMDSDMNQYFEEKKTLLEDIPRGENPGTAYYSFYPAVINPKLFYAYILAIKYFQDGTCRWKLCLTSRENEECHMTLGIMRGTEEEAKERLATILTSGSIR